MKNAVIYARYSSDKQDEASIDAQVRACREYAASKGYAVLEVYADEAVSGKGSKTASRKAYQKLLRDVNKGRFDTILIHKYDRVARNLGEHVNLEKKLKDRAVELIAVAQDFGSSSEAKIMKTLMWSLSEYYLDNLSSETKKGHRETAMKAKHNGGCAPFGYDVVNQEYVVNELEAGYVRKIFDAAANRESFTAIIEELAAAEITSKRGKPIKYTQIYEMLRNEKYTVVREHKGDKLITAVREGVTKTVTSVRTLPLCDLTIAELNRLKTRQERNRQRCGNCYNTDYRCGSCRWRKRSGRQRGKCGWSAHSYTPGPAHPRRMQSGCRCLLRGNEPCRPGSPGRPAWSRSGKPPRRPSSASTSHPAPANRRSGGPRECCCPSTRRRGG